MKIRELLKNGIDELNKNKIEDSFFKAKILLAFVYEVDIPYLNIHIYDEVNDEFVKKYEGYIQNVISGIPVQYITNHQEFYGLDFYVNRDVLIPQPDTEVLVEEIIDIAKKSDKKIRIVDMCTGSGAIAIAISKNIEAEVWASDISEKALEIAKRNAVAHGVNIKFLKSDMFENINGKFDIIVSNPPYIETSTIEKLSKEVKNEPLIALDGGEDGLEFYRILAKNAKKYLSKYGFLAVEIGYNQGEVVNKMFADCGLVDVYVKKDFCGNDRIVVGKVV